MEVKEIFEKAGLKKVRVKSNNIYALCPNPEHNDRRLGSFVISLEKGIMKCFSCGWFSDTFSFLVSNGIDIDTAFEFYKVKTQYVEKEYKDDYQESDLLPKSLIDRGFSIETLEYFRVSYNRKEKHIEFPLYFNGILKGILYRRFPKYFGYSEGFDRRYFIYNYAETKERIYTEGITDVMRGFENGERNISATLGAEISDYQLKLMEQHEIVYLAYDLDFAGIRAMFKIANHLIKWFIKVKVILFSADLGKKNDLGNCSKKCWGNKEIVDFIDFELGLLKRNRVLYEQVIKNLDV